MMYIIVIGDRWYITTSDHDAKAFKRFWKVDTVVRQVVYGKQTGMNRIVFIPNLKVLMETFQLKFI